jgi:hypothetical protein
LLQTRRSGVTFGLQVRCVRTAVLLLCLAAPVFGPVVGRAADETAPLAEARETVAQWVQTRQLISGTKSGWESDRETLEQTKALFERELAQVREKFSKVSTHSSVADQERETAESRLKRHVDALEDGAALAAQLEDKVRSVLPLLPAPLLATLKAVTDRLPADSSTTKAAVTERLQTVVALLNEVDKFNSAVTVAPEKRANAKGEQVAVDTLYLGLAGAWFADSTGELAGSGTPTAKGWQWKIQPEIGSQVRDAVAVYRSQRPAAFVALPASVQ